MSHIRIFIDRDFYIGDFVKLPQKEQEHLKVRRATRGDTIFILNGRGKEAEAILEDTGRAKIVRVKDLKERELPVEVWLYQSILKSDKMDLVVQKATELGAKVIIPVLSERCVSSPKSTKIIRWQKIAVESLKQCGRGYLPEIKEFTSLDSLKFESGKTLLLWEKAEKHISQVIEKTQRINVIVGPEGSFTEEEVEKLTRNGATPVHIGKVILRSETASVYILSVIKFLAEGLWRL